jgi:hypothetical protein
MTENDATDWMKNGAFVNHVGKGPSPIGRQPGKKR